MTTPEFARDALRIALQDDPFWRAYLHHIEYPQESSVSLHLAILVNPYLQRIFDGTKTIESRFSTQRRVPYRQVETGDIILLKRAGGPIVGIGLVNAPMFYQLTPVLLQHIQMNYADALGITEPAFWDQQARAAFATLMPLLHVRPITPIPFIKRDQRAWIILQRRVPHQLRLPYETHLAAD
ncbi:MAG: ASCH domain-containing protein [Chloroflexia bacterium]|nr:ASCH domain-containing protein [Chloroflexia bacterium]